MFQPVQSGYRNKCEFTIGQDIDKNGKKLPLIGQLFYGKFVLPQ